MSGSKTFKPCAGAAAAILLAMALAGCSGRDAEAAEKLAAADAAAARAEKAAERAELAWQKIEKASQPQVIEVDPNATEDAEDAEIAKQNEPVDPAADIKS